MRGALTGKGINAQRKILSGQSNFDNELNDLVTTAEPRFMYRAVVVDVLFDPIRMHDELIEKYSDISNVDLLTTAPCNSIIARVVSDGADKRSTRAAVFYPFFSHTHQPVKPGEKVWIVYENPEGSRVLGYWLTRIVERRDVNDSNFTHGDRIFVDDLTPSTIDRTDSNRDEYVPGFPNGSDTEEGFTLLESDAYEKIEENAIASRVSTKQPVPRYKKRPNDWAAEGSDNALIVLGEDRTGPTVELLSTGKLGRPSNDKKNSSMFDIVLGRGLGQERKYPDVNAKPTLTSPGVLKNSRGKLETDKRIENENPSEGDVDFENDVTRLYGSTDTDIDGNFGKQLPKLNSNNEPERKTSGAAVIAKSDNIRVIARRDGTIRIIKEGDIDNESGTGHAMITIEKDGTIMIDGPRIIMGSGIEKQNGAGTQLYLGRDATEPLVLGQTLKNVVTEYSSQINSSIEGFTDALKQLSTALTTPPNSLGNFAIPLPGMLTISQALLSASATLKETVGSATQKLHTDLQNTLSRNGKLK